MLKSLKGLTIAATLSAAVALTPAAAQDGDYILSTAGTGGTYYPVGVALATLIKVRLQPSQGIGVSAITSAGSGENIKLLREEQADFAIIQGLWGAYAADGTGPMETDGAQENLRSVTMLWPNVEQFAIRNEFAPSGTADDIMGLEGRGFAIGARNSGTEGSNRAILGGLGIDDPDGFFEVAYVGYSPSVEAFQNGQIDAVNIATGAPAGAMTQLMSTSADAITPINFTAEQIERANDGRNLWTAYTIPAGTYPNQDEDWNTMAQPNFLAVNASVDEEHVYQITKTIYENLGFLQNIHRATNAMSLDVALAGLPVPLHPGAARYFQEAGIDVPEYLIAE